MLPSRLVRTLVRMADDEAGGGLGSWTKLLGAVAAVVSAVAGLIAIVAQPAQGSASPETPPPKEAPHSIPEEAGKAYLALIAAYNQRDEGKYYAGFAEPMECFYSKPSASIRSERASLNSRLQVSTSDLAALDVQHDRVEFCDRGHWQKDQKMVQHHKIIVMKRIDGRWLVEVETSSDQRACYRSRFTHQC